MNWYVQIQNQTYGPYSEAQMQGFVSEGRVNEHSLISNTPADGFFAAVGYDVFSLWAGTGQVAVGGGSAYQYAPQTTQTTTVPEAVSPVSAPVNTPNAQSSVFMIMAEIRSEGAMAFLKALQGFGTAQRIGDTLWVLRSAHSVEQIRNTLSQSLNRQDRLFILDSSANKTAWFNIGADLDHRIRELWSEEED